MRSGKVTGPEPGGCTDGLRGRLSSPSVQTPRLRLPRWLPLRGTRATAILLVLGDTQSPTLPATQARVHSAMVGSLPAPMGGGHPAQTHNSAPTIEAARRQRGGLPKFSTRVRPRAGPSPPKSCSTEAGAGVPGWSRAGRKGPMRRVSSASGSFGLPVACGSAPHCGVRMRVLGDPRGWAPKQVHIVAPPPTSCGMVKSTSS